MASRGVRQRLKGSGGSGGDTASAADKLRELLCSREAGVGEPRSELSGNKAGQVWAPEGSTAFKYLLSARLCAALLSNISDCDETFNYWEPTHYLIYGKGFQTWEYSPAYAIRSYAYLLLHAWPAAFHARILQTNKSCVQEVWTACESNDASLLGSQHWHQFLYVHYIDSHDWLVYGQDFHCCAWSSSWDHLRLAIQCSSWVRH
uniref:Mannosyltransferase n=1 Tax=Equus asinus asinus TaxID=83772 RepID=A0A8C4LI04_EQUAS